MEAISRSWLPEAAARTKRQRKATCCGVVGAASHRTTCSRSSAAKLTSGLILAMRTHISYWPQYVYLFMIHMTSWLESRTVTANSLPCSTTRTRISICTHIMDAFGEGSESRQPEPNLREQAGYRQEPDRQERFPLSVRLLSVTCLCPKVGIRWKRIASTGAQP